MKKALHTIISTTLLITIGYFTGTALFKDVEYNKKTNSEEFIRRSPFFHKHNLSKNNDILLNKKFGDSDFRHFVFNIEKNGAATPWKNELKHLLSFPESSNNPYLMLAMQFLFTSWGGTRSS